MYKITTIKLILFSILMASFGQDGMLDSTFGNGGQMRVDPGPDEEFLQAMEIYPDGRIILAGHHLSGTIPSLNADYTVSRLKGNGAPDSTFGNQGTVQPIASGAANDICLDMKLLPNGEILLAGGSMFFTNSAKMRLVNLNADGTGWGTKFGSTGKAAVTFSGPSGANCLEVLDDGRIILAGYMLDGANFTLALARLLSDGSLDPSFGAGGKVTLGNSGDDINITDLIVQADGKIVLGGNIKRLSAPVFSQDVYLARFDTNGILDSNFGSNGVASFNSGNTGYGGYAKKISAMPDGSLVVAGQGIDTSSHSTFSMMLAKFSADGVLDTSFGNYSGFGIYFDQTGEGASGNGLVVQPDGKILIAGLDSSDFDGPRDESFLILRAHPDGKVDSTWGQNGVAKLNMEVGNFERAKSIGLAPDGKLLVAGDVFVDAGTTDLSEFGIARFSNAISVGLVEPDESVSEVKVFPNPIQSDVQMTYSLPTSAHVSLDLYDLSGRKVYTFFQEAERLSGPNLEWLSFPEGLERSIYLLRLSSDQGGQKTIRVMLR